VRSRQLARIPGLLGGHGQEDRLWQHTLTQVAAHFGVNANVETNSICIDRGRQWRHAGNLWHNASIRTALYMGMLPPRVLFRSVRNAAKKRR
jgi:hypothetical protein